MGLIMLVIEWSSPRIKQRVFFLSLRRWRSLTGSQSIVIAAPTTAPVVTPVINVIGFIFIPPLSIVCDKKSSVKLIKYSILSINFL